MLLKGGFEKHILVLGDIPLCSQILLMRCRWVSPIYYVDWHSTRIFINNIGRHHKLDLIFKWEQRVYSVSINKNTP